MPNGCENATVKHFEDKKQNSQVSGFLRTTSILRKMLFFLTRSIVLFR